MRKFVFVISCLMSFFVSCSSGNDNNENNKPDVAKKDTLLIFSDEFNTNGHPDVNKWSLCEKGTSEWNNEFSQSYDQAYVRDGNLVLIGDKIGGVYKSGGISSINKFAFTFGKIDIKARILNHPDGNFPAIWLYPIKNQYEGYPQGGEIDIMEHRNQDAYVSHTVHTNYTLTLGHNTEPSNTANVTCNYSEYNIYTMIWTTKSLIFKINGKTTFVYPNLGLSNESTVMQWPFTSNSAFFIIMNMALVDNNIDDAHLPAEMDVDYVRVYSIK